MTSLAVTSLAFRKSIKIFCDEFGHPMGLCKISTSGCLRTPGKYQISLLLLRKTLFSDKENVTFVVFEDADCRDYSPGDIHAVMAFTDVTGPFARFVSWGHRRAVYVARVDSSKATL